MEATLEAEAATELSEETTEATEAAAEEETELTAVLFPAPTVPFPRGAPAIGVGAAEAEPQTNSQNRCAFEYLI